MLRRNFALAGCAALLALTAGCADMHRSMMSERADTRETDTKAVKDVETAWSRDAATKNPVTFAAYYAEDATMLLPGARSGASRGALSPKRGARGSKPSWRWSSGGCPDVPGATRATPCA